MLYISRYIDNDRYGVFDTDDGTEEIVSIEDTWNAIQSGVDIKGVEVIKRSKLKAWGRNPVVLTPYQPVETMSVHQVKMMTLQHVRTCVFKDKIASITWYPDQIREPVTIKLSSLGRVMCFDCIVDNRYSDRHVVTLLFDNSLKLEEHALCVSKAYTHMGVMLDLRAVTQTRVAHEIYKQICMYFTHDEALKYVIDDRSRKYRLLKKFEDGAYAVR